MDTILLMLIIFFKSKSCYEEQALNRGVSDDNADLYEYLRTLIHDRVLLL